MEILVIIIVIVVAIVFFNSLGNNKSNHSSTGHLSTQAYTTTSKEELESFDYEAYKYKREKEETVDKERIFNEFKDCKKMTIGVVGMYYRTNFAKEIIPTLSVKDKISLKKEPQNEYDSFAVKVMYARTHLGYVPAKLSKDVTDLIDRKKIQKILIDKAGETKVNSWDEGDLYLNIIIFYKE